MSISYTKPVAVYTDRDDTDVSAGAKLLEDAGFVVEFADTRDPEELCRKARHATALLVGYAQITEAVIRSLPQLKVISVMSMGTDNIDTAVAAELGIPVLNVTGAATEEVAVHTLALILQHARQLREYAALAKPETWNDRYPIPPRRLTTQTLGLVGLGRIGRKVAEYARPMFGSIIGYDPLVQPGSAAATELAAAGITAVSLDTVCAESDVVSLHLPLTPETQGMVDADFLKRMRRQALLVNVSRGALINEADLVRALDDNELTGAALDVITTEPPAATDPLLRHKKVFLTPHIGYYSLETEADYVRIHAQNIVEWYAAQGDTV